MTYSTLDSCPRPARFPVTTFTTKLPASGQETTPLKTDFVRFLSVQSEVSWGRLLHVSNQNQRPFDVELSWTGGGGIGNSIRVTAGGGMLVIPLQAKSITVSIANWTLADMLVHASIENGAPTTMDLRRALVEQTLGAGATQDFAVPKYAREVLVQPSDSTLVGNVAVNLLNQTGNTVAQFGGGEYVPVSPASKLQIENTGGVAFTFYYLDFKLGYQ
jgi:hypothetical protein